MNFLIFFRPAQLHLWRETGFYGSRKIADTKTQYTRAGRGHGTNSGLDEHYP